MILSGWNDTVAPYRLDLTLADMFEEQARRTPDEIAVIAGEQRVTYRDLNARANRLAHRLQESGVRSETMVGICLPRGVDLLVAVFAILKAGGAYVPLDPAYPSERVRFMLQDSGALMVLTVPAHAELVSGTEAEVCCLDSEDLNKAGDPDGDPDRETTGDNLAYVIYTSGSTGRPKGVAIEHRNVAALLAWAGEVFSREDLTGMLFSTSICFDLSVFEMMLPLTHGGRIVVADNVLEVADLPAAGEVTFVNTMPSAMAELVQGRRIPESVRIVCLAGEALPTSLVNDIYRTTRAERVYDLYGPSEDTTYSTWALREADGPNTIGRPISNTRAYVLDENGAPVPVGVAGDLFLAGDGIARGYLNRPELTNERFGPDPFVIGDGQRMYDTGDLARFFPDGRLEFLGRRDSQVKIRGYRVELGEIEAVLREHPEVHNAAVLARRNGGGDLELVAYAATPEAESDDGPLLDFLRQRLPAFMVPQRLMTLETLPSLPNGKINRGALAEIRPATKTAEPVAPAGEMEALVAQTWQEVLGLTSVDVTADFFELGGNSLQAVRVLNRLEERLGVRAHWAAMFDAPTVRQLAAFLADQPVSDRVASLDGPPGAEAREREEFTL